MFIRIFKAMFFVFFLIFWMDLCQPTWPILSPSGWIPALSTMTHLKKEWWNQSSLLWTWLMYFPIILAVINQQFHLFLKATHNKLSLVTEKKKKRTEVILKQLTYWSLVINWLMFLNYYFLCVWLKLVFRNVTH